MCQNFSFLTLLYVIHVLQIEMAILAEMAQLPDIRFLIKAATKEVADNPIEGWRLYKEHVTEEQKTKQQQQQAQNKSLISKLRGLTSSSKAQEEMLFDRISKIIQDRRKQHASHIKEQLAEMQKYTDMMEKERLKQIEGMKAKNMKMMDYMFGEAPPPPSVPTSP